MTTTHPLYIYVAVYIMHNKGKTRHDFHNLSDKDKQWWIDRVDESLAQIEIDKGDRQGTTAVAPSPPNSPQNEP